MAAASRCTLNRLEVTVAERKTVTPCTGIDLYSNKYSCQAVLDKGAWDGSEPGAWDAPPLNRLAVLEKVLPLDIFAMLL